MLIAISLTFDRIGIMDPSAFRVSYIKMASIPPEAKLILEFHQVLFAAAWVFPGLLLCGLPFLPESPYWLALQGDNAGAERMLGRLRGKKSDIQGQMAHIIATAEAERAMSATWEKTSFLDCFRGTDWRRTRIILICNYMPQIVGGTLSANAPYFLNQTGMPPDTVVTLIQVGVSFGVASSLLNVYLMTRFTYRHLIFFGISLCTILFLVMGIAGCFTGSKNALW